MISTGGTIVEAIDKLMEMGARPGVVVAATHGLLLGGARARLTAAPIADIFVTDSIEQTNEGWTGLHVVSVAPLLADAIRRVTSIALHVS
jgi:ribose-phosphate pyrophosphokinase